MWPRALSSFEEDMTLASEGNPLELIGNLVFHVGGGCFQFFLHPQFA